MLATIPSPPDNVLELGPLTVHYYGLAIAIGAILAVLLARRRWAFVGGDPDVVDRIAFWAVLAGLVGARLAYVLPRLDRFGERPLSILFVWEGGLAFFGGVILGAVTALWLARRNDIPLPAFVDAAIPGVPLAQAIGRWGNYFNQELYGTPTDLPWGLEITHEPTPVHPTFLYESLYNLLLVVGLVYLGRRRRLREGSLLFCYMIAYGVGRFLLEFIRTDVATDILGVRANQWVALLVLVVGAAFLVRWQRRDTDRRTGDPLPVPPDAEAAEDIDEVATEDEAGERVVQEAPAESGPDPGAGDTPDEPA